MKQPANGGVRFGKSPIKLRSMSKAAQKAQMKIFAAKFVFYFLLAHPQAIAPLNQTGVATNCDNATIQCTYVDTNVPPGPHFYFAVASNTFGPSTPSNRVDVTLTSTQHTVTLKWTPSSSVGTASSPIMYFIYRGAPATNLKIIGTPH